MKKMISTAALALSFFACVNLLVPDVLRAEMIKSQLQDEQHIETVRKKLCSKEMLPLIRKFGFSDDEAMQIRDVVTDTDVLTSLADLGNGANRTGRSIMIDSGRFNRVQETLTQSAEKNANDNLRTKILHKGERMTGLKTENLIESKLSAGKTGRAVTYETLVAMGMSETDAGRIVDRMNGDDFERILRGDVKIAFGATPSFSGGLAVFIPFFLLIVIAILLIIGLNFLETGIILGSLLLTCFLVYHIVDYAEDQMLDDR